MHALGTFSIYSEATSMQMLTGSQQKLSLSVPEGPCPSTQGSLDVSTAAAPHLSSTISFHRPQMTGAEGWAGHGEAKSQEVGAAKQNPNAPLDTCLHPSAFILAL